MVPTLKIPGISCNTAAKAEELAKDTISISLPLTIAVQEVVDVASAREAGGAVTVALEPPPKPEEKRRAGHVCEVELEGGVTLWLRPASLYRDFGVPQARGVAQAGEEDVWEIAPALSRPGAARGGITEQHIRRVTVYRWERSAEPPPVIPAEGQARGAAAAIAEAGVDFVVDKIFGAIAGRFAGSVGRAVERHQLRRDPGLYRVDFENTLAMTAATEIRAEGPVLLFLHGTMSSFEGSFDGLWDENNTAGAEARAQLARRYCHAYSWEHYTLTESPIENALKLAQKLEEMLPDGAKLHLVSHSRGGLVGDLLSLGRRVEGAEPLSITRIREFFELAAGVHTRTKGDDRYKEQAELLCALIRILDRKKFIVERYVRVACPARGTTLASGKLDRWLSVVKLLTDLVIPYNFPLQLLIALIGEHDDPSQLPGLEAMMPDSPLLRLLNCPALQVKADLSVISGDTEGKGVFGRLKELMLDQFFEDECDIIVNTGAMFGGLKRTDGGRFHLDSGPDVNHFSYFRNDATVRMVVAGLLRSEGADATFHPLALAPGKEPARAVLHRAPQGPLPVVFVLPGIMGSTLEANGNRIWLDILDLMMGRFGKLAIDREVTPNEPFQDYYGDLMERLRETHEVVPFPYDWRRSVLQAGEALAKQVNARLDEIERQGTNQPVRILSHSMGGLVARAMIAQKPEVWRRMTAHEGSRLIMLGTPNGGSYEIVRLLTGYATTLRQLALLDFTRDWKELLGIIARFPGVLELLPIENDYQFFKAEFWRDLREDDDEMRDQTYPLPAAADLLQARRTWETILSAPLNPGCTLYVAGQARQTPIGWRVETEKDPEHIFPDRRVIVFEATARGDGRVPWDTGIPQYVRTWYLPDVEHGDLPAHEEAFPAYVELLQSGATSLLPMSPPAGVRAAAVEQRTILARDLPATLPDERELAGSILGSGSSRRRKKARVRLPKVTVSITHGDLGYALYPVMVGHYLGDTIVSAEDFLDRALGGRLRERHQLGLYPGNPGTCVTMLSHDRFAKPGGAIVVGLGRVGELTPGSLEAAVTQAALEYAIQVAECRDERFRTAPGVPRVARITSLLIGTGAGGIMVRDSIEAILRGVAAANRRLHDQGMTGKVSIGSVEFMELWQDVAIQGAAELERALLGGTLADHFIWQEHTVRSGEGGRKRVQFEEPPNWWHRMEIAHDKEKDELRFIALTKRARAEESLVTGQLRLAEDLIRETITYTRRDPRVTRALFEMLIPNRLKELAPNQYDVVLVVDEESGSYPWELLEDRWGVGDKPVAVTSGMLRQLKTDVYRERPVTTLEDTAYVVGDPALPPPRHDFPFTSLDGARREAVAVADLLQQNGFTVNRRIREDARAILAGLHSEGYRVLHLAGHGVHEQELPLGGTSVTCETCKQSRPPQTKKVSGMVIGDKIYLTPGDVEQMRWVPELVFINCCHLGSLSPHDATAHLRLSHRLAANIAAQFIRMGVKAVVAAGWAVDDAAAETFATGFYRRLLAGDPFGDAVRSAREETFCQHGTTNTWGAYQCYGDPDFRLRPRKPGNKSAWRKNYVSVTQVVTDLENLTSRARLGADCADEVDAVVAAIRGKDEKWLGRSDVAAALGIAYGEICLFKQAVEHLDKAIAGEKAGYPLRVLEQRANFKSRWAVELKHGKKPKELIKEAIDDLETLVKFGETSERLSLLGSAHKRGAWIAQGNERKKALSAMAGFYRKAHEKKYDEANGEMDTYPLLNWLAAELLREWYGEKQAVTRAEIREWCEKARAYGQKKDLQDPNFWNSVVTPECDLVEALAGDALGERRQAIVDAYRYAKARGASSREFRSVLDHIEFLADMAADIGKEEGMQKQAAALREIVEQLRLPDEAESIS